MIFLIIVIAMFSKNEAANFTAAERGQIGKWLKQMEGNFR